MGWLVDTLSSRIRTITSLSQLSPFCESADVVCFDVFDTLLDRTVEPPDVLKRRTANYAAQLLSRRGFPITADLFLYMRDQAEARLRRRAQRNGADPECRLTNIVYEAVRSLLGPEIAIEEAGGLVQYEVEVECYCLRVAPGTQELLRTLRSRGKKVIVASDTYLEKMHLEQIFRHLEIDCYIDAIYVSSEYCAGKYSSLLFRKILESEAIEPRRMVHVGDSYERDVRGAIKSGVPAVFLFDIQRRRQRRQVSRLTKWTLAGRDAALLRKQSQESQAANYDSLTGGERELFKIGRDILGPAFTLFLLHVIEECYRWGVSEVYYLAREGFLFRQIHDTLTENIRRFQRLPPIPHHYLYVSRLATSLPAIRALGDRELSLAAFRDRTASLGECLRTFGLEPSEFSDLLVKFQGGDEAARRRLFSDPRFAERIQARAELERLRLRAYLAQEGFFVSDKTKALVDIGWFGTIQANLTRAFHDSSDFPMLIGLYFGRRYSHDDDYYVSSRSTFMPGFFYDENREGTSERAIRHCVQIFEIAAGAPHGATLGYKETDRGVEPVLNSSPTALSREQELLQAGIMDHAVSFSKAYNDYETDLPVMRERVVRRLATFLLTPTLKQVKALRGVVHFIDWGSAEARPLIATNLTPVSIFTPARLVRSLQSTFWAEGSLRMSRIPAALLVLVVARRVLEAWPTLRRGLLFCLNFFRRHPEKVEWERKLFTRTKEYGKKPRGVQRS